VPYLQILLLILLACSSDTGVAQLSDLVPRPEVSPEQVVLYQVDSLRQNDIPKADAGIERAFRFASPSNKEVTGPLEKFVQILKGPVYSPMLNNISSSIVGCEVKGDQARVAVRIVSADGRQLTYVFVLSRQGEGDFTNCWMTDGVAPLKQGEDASAEGVTI
jgi:Domain of unknown function (DUF4864)